MIQPYYTIDGLIFRHASVKKMVLDINGLNIAVGKITALLGPNGSGKTTLLKILAGLTHFEHGIIRKNGKLISSNEYQDLRIGSVYVHQSPVLFRRSVFENVVFGLKLKRLDQSILIERGMEAIASVGLEGYEERKSRDLSVGEIQRVALARAIALRPEVLLLDEPTANVDSASVLKIEAVLLELNRRFGMTVLFSSHHTFFGEKISQHTIVLKEGKVTEIYENNRDKSSS